MQDNWKKEIILEYRLLLIDIIELAFILVYCSNENLYSHIDHFTFGVCNIHQFTTESNSNPRLPCVLV